MGGYFLAKSENLGNKAKKIDFSEDDKFLDKKIVRPLMQGNVTKLVISIEPTTSGLRV